MFRLPLVRNVSIVVLSRSMPMVGHALNLPLPMLSDNYCTYKWQPFFPSYVSKWGKYTARHCCVTRYHLLQPESADHQGWYILKRKSGEVS